MLFGFRRSCSKGRDCTRVETVQDCYRQDRKHQRMLCHLGLTHRTIVLLSCNLRD